MTPQEAYEKRYAAIDNGQHTWDAAPPHVKEMWLAAWTMAESGEREACAQICEEAKALRLSEIIRARGEE